MEYYNGNIQFIKSVCLEVKPGKVFLLSYEDSIIELNESVHYSGGFIYEDLNPIFEFTNYSIAEYSNTYTQNCELIISVNKN